MQILSQKLKKVKVKSGFVNNADICMLNFCHY